MAEQHPKVTSYMKKLMDAWGQTILESFNGDPLPLGLGDGIFRMPLPDVAEPGYSHGYLPLHNEFRARRRLQDEPRRSGHANRR